MKLYLFITLALLTLIISCERADNGLKTYSLRDAVTKEHLQSLDSLEYADTTDINYKVLKAYLANDTAFFSKLKSDIDKINKNKQRYKDNDSCIHQKPLQQLNADEAYRFVYTASFCDKKLNVTVTRNAGSANIHFILYQDVWLHDECKVISEYDKKISAKNWKDFSQIMDKSDFWGLKSTNGRDGLDGSTLIVTGFTNGYGTHEIKPKYSYVYRWGYSTLSEPFEFILKLSGNRQGCLVIK
jgi:hypothetical protein